MTDFLNITLRRLLKEKVYALICIFSLALGLSASILISLYLISEFSFDTYHRKHEQIYRISTDFSSTLIPQAGYEIGPLMVQENPQILDVVRLRRAFESRFSYGDNETNWEDVYLADNSVFDIFTVEPLRGDLETAFQERYSIAINQTMAEFYFGDDDPIGQTLSTERFDFRITLVFEDVPENVTRQFQALLPMELIEVYRAELFNDFGERYISSFDTFVLVAEQFDPLSIAATSETIFRDHMASGFGGATGNFDGLELTHQVQRLRDIHFTPISIPGGSTGSRVNLTIFTAVMVALLLSSCFNYVNLTTARISTRTHEVAMKKLLGASARNIVIQFVFESVLFVLLAFTIGILLAIIVIELGLVESLTGKAELGDLLLSPVWLSLFILAGLGIGVVSGIYPAKKLAQPSIMSMMNPQQGFLRRRLSLRPVLVWLQMSVAIAIIACAIIMLRQSDYLLNTPLGFKKENQLVVRVQGAEEIQGREALMNELRQHNEIVNVVEMSGAIGRSLSISILPVETNTGQTRNLTINPFRGGEELLETLEIELLTGNMFVDADTASANGSVLVNETLVRQMEWEQPIGKQVGGNTVIGVIRDFHYLPLHQTIGAVYIAPYSDGFLQDMTPEQRENVSMDLVISFSGNDEAQVRATIMDTVDRYSDQSVIDVRSIEDVWNSSYDDDSRTIELVAIFAGLSILISLLGLGGMAAYSNQRRSKEVAIRKVLGASVPRILGILSSGTLVVLGLAMLPAFVGAYLITNSWLDRFAYQSDSAVYPYLAALLIVALCCAVVLILQSLRVARANPVLRLRQE